VVARLVSYLRVRGFKQGVLGSNRHWFAVWAGIGFASFLHKRLTKQPVVVERFVLREGQTLEIRDTGISREAIRAIER
jgi:hypothetical protein